MLPLATQVRKAIWEAVNPATGKKRIDEAFPKSLRATTREQEMFIKFKNGSTWQALGSDNYESGIGSSPVGIVFSEWAQSNPSSRGYLRPILTENDGWEIYISTPRGKNHCWTTYNAAKKNDGQFAELLTVADTGVLTAEQLKIELREYTDTYGDDLGNALYNQEYFCSFEAAILGAFYASEFAKIDKENRIGRVNHDSDYPVHTAWDIGRTDDTAIWWYQIIAGEIRVLDYYANSFKNPDHFCSEILGREVILDIVNNEVIIHYGPYIQRLDYRRKYKYGVFNLPHDARAKTFAAQGKSIQEQFSKVFGWASVRIVPNLGKQDGIKASRLALNKAVFDEKCMQGTEALRQYQRLWDDTRKMYRDTELHNWTSHPADAWRMLAVAWVDETPKKEEKENIYPVERTMDQLVAMVKKRRIGERE